MKSILLFGAGKSTTSLIDYLGKICDEKNWKFQICDADLSLAQFKSGRFSCAEAISFDVNDTPKRQQFISASDIIISMLPPALHFLVAKDCVAFSKNLLTASYIDTNYDPWPVKLRKKGCFSLGKWD